MVPLGVRWIVAPSACAVGDCILLFKNHEHKGPEDMKFVSESKNGAHCARHKSSACFFEIDCLLMATIWNPAL